MHIYKIEHECARFCKYAFVYEQKLQTHLQVIISVDTISAGMTEADYFWFLSTFISLYPFLDGTYHIESIMCHKQLDRSAVVRILDLFADIIVVLVSQAHVVHKKVSEFPTRIFFV